MLAAAGLSDHAADFDLGGAILAIVVTVGVMLLTGWLSYFVLQTLAEVVVLKSRLSLKQLFAVIASVAAVMSTWMALYSLV